MEFDVNNMPCPACGVQEVGIDIDVNKEASNGVTSLFEHAMKGGLLTEAVRAMNGEKPLITEILEDNNGDGITIDCGECDFEATLGEIEERFS